MATIGGCINKNIVRTFFQASLNDSFQVFVLNLKLFKGKVIHVNNEFIISVFDLCNQLIQILKLMLVNLNHTKSLIVIFIQDALDAGGFSGSGIAKKQTVVCFLALDKRFRVVDQLLLWNFVADKIRKAHIRNVGNRDNLNVLSCMRNTKGLVKSQFSHSEIFVKLNHISHKFICGCSLCQTDGQLTDTIPDFFVEQFIRTVRVLIGTDDRGIAGLKNFIKNTDIKIKQFFETDKVVFCHLVDASLYFSDNLARGRECIFFVYQQIRQIIMPEISGEAVAVCHLDKAVQCLIKLRLICAHILTEPAVLQGNLSIDQFFVGLHQYRHIAQYLPLCEIAVEDTFFYSNHLLSLPSCHFSFYLCEKAAWYGPLFWINNFRKSGISRILPAIRAVRF